MKVKTAKTAGFCFGVKRAVDKVYELIENGVSPIYTLGPIIHNEEVVSDFEKKGVTVISEEDIPKLREGTVVIRSHGVGRRIYDMLKTAGNFLCRRNLSFCSEDTQDRGTGKQGRKTDYHIWRSFPPGGKRDLRMVRGVPVLFSETERMQKILSRIRGEYPCIVSQTTFNYNKFKELVEILCKKRYDNNVLNIDNILNTICNATEERQKEAQSIAGEVDTMLVIGGRHSSNTQKLFEICKEECGNTYYIQTPVDLDSEMFHHSSYVGITAGASTPKKIIEEVQEHVRIKF